MNLKDRLKQWRAYSQASSNKLHRSSWLIAEELNLKIFTTYELKYFQIPTKGTLISDINLVEHYKQIGAYWCATDVGDNRITTQDTEETHDDDINALDDDDINALDDIGIMNLEKQWRGKSNVLPSIGISGFSHYSVLEKNCSEMLISFFF